MKPAPQLTFTVLNISQKFVQIKSYLNFILIILCSTSKGFMKAFTTFIKPFEVPQISMEIKV